MKNRTTLNATIDFFKKLPRRQNIPVMIYLAINIVIIYFFNVFVIAMLLESLNISISDTVIYIVSAPVSALLYGLGIYISLSPVGEWALRKQSRCREIDDEETAERMNAVFGEVYGRAKEVNQSIPDDVKLYICKDEDINAFAIGRKTICITEGALALPDDELKGVIGHEFGHISNHDTDLSLVVNVANAIVTGYFIAIKLIIDANRLILKPITFISCFVSKTIGELVTKILLYKLLDLVYFVAVTLISALWTAFGNLLVKSSTRGNEYLADAFSKQLGYAEPLSAFLSTVDDDRRKLNIFKRISARLSDTHPTPKKRINALCAA